MMSSVTTFFAFFLLSTFTLQLHSTTAAPVFDTDGEPLRNGGEYYITSDIGYPGMQGGGITLTKTGKETCPLTVVQSNSVESRGSPIEISSPYRIAFIDEFMILELTFSDAPSCVPHPSRWTVVKGLPEGPAVKVTGYKNTVSGWFRIERVSLSSYKLVFCPTDSDDCGNVGVYVDDDNVRRLVVSQDNPIFIVRFEKVTSSDA